MILLEEYVAGKYIKGAGFRYFMPEMINDQWQWTNPEINMLLERASIQLGALNSFARLVPNIDLFIELHVKKEAVQSSRIEGTQTNMEESVLPEEEISPERRDDWREVKNYTVALNDAVASLATLPLSSRLVKQTHKVLLNSVRGKYKLPGEFRTSQNWIGGSGPSDAIFTPPSHIYVDDLMSDLEKFLHNDEIAVPALIKIGIAHYQFETIHPFLDGNGRIGRLLITLFLMDKQILQQPLLYLSSYFEKNKSLYYDNLTRVREKNDMTQWLKYFLVGVSETAEKAVNTLSQVIKLKQSLEMDIQQNWGRRIQPALALLNYLFLNPVVTVKTAADVCNVSIKTAGELIDSFISSNIIHEITKQSRNRIFTFHVYLELFGH